jgi:GT2 family glycosyltransferase
MEVEKDVPFVTCVMPNWNGKDDTLECLDSLSQLDYPKHRIEIIIVDNGSQDGSQEIIRKKFKEMERFGFWRLLLIENVKNIGAPAAYNKGIKAAHPEYDYIFKLDNDVVLKSDALKHLVEVSENDDKVGIAGGTVFYYSAPEIVWLTGLKLNPYLMKGKCEHSHQHKSQIEFEKIAFYDEIPGCSCLIKKKLLEKIGLFDENYFIYTDDADFCMRSRKGGYSNIWVSKTIIWHKIANTTKKISGFGLYYIIRNRIIFQRKHASFWEYLMFTLYMWLFRYPLDLIGFSDKDIVFLQAYLRGIKDGYLQTLIKC